MKKSLLVLALLSSTALSAQSLNGFGTKFYGFLKASSMFATEALGSFNNVNLSAPTHAVAHTKTSDKTSRLSFQTQQSRAGVTLEKELVEAKLEFDFIDFAKSSPTVQANPRVRIATVTYHLPQTKFVFGQDWDLFSPVAAYTYDYVGLYFLAGNTGFMRQQFQVLQTAGSWELGGAVGMAGNNPGTTDTDLELAKGPTYAARLSHALQDGRVGFSGIYASLRYDSNGARHDAYGLNLFLEKTVSRMSIRSEAYYGQNLANIGALSIGKGTDTKDVREFGGTLTIQRKISDVDVLFGGVGWAKADNRTEVSPFSMNATSTITNPGIASNFLSRFGWERKITADLSALLEVSRYETRSKLTTNYEVNDPYGVETGVTLRF